MTHLADLRALSGLVIAMTTLVILSNKTEKMANPN